MLRIVHVLTHATSRAERTARPSRLLTAAATAGRSKEMMQPLSFAPLNPCSSLWGVPPHVGETVKFC